MCDEVYCALCGVPFDIYVDLYRSGSIRKKDVEWTKYFVALTKAEATGEVDDSTWFLSGVGDIDGAIGFEGLIPPPGYDARSKALQEDDKSKPSTIIHAKAYTNHGSNAEVVYPMHPACWHIFLQKHAIISTYNPSYPNLEKLGELFSRQDVAGDGRGLVPEWAGDYDGPEQFWEDGWSWNEEPETSVVAGLLEESPEWDFLVRNPDNSQGFETLLANPPLLAATAESPPPISMVTTIHDILCRLPEELLLEIICLLPTASIHNLRLASRAIASIHLNTRFWRSRFIFPNELCHIQLPSGLLQTNQRDHPPVDWQELCYRLLHPENTTEYQWWRNRKRIASLNEKLVYQLLTKDAIGEPAYPLGGLICPRSFSCPGQKVSSEASALLPNSSSSSLTFSTTFRTAKGAQYLSGISFASPESSVEVGFCDPGKATRTLIDHCSNIMGFFVTLHVEGIVGLAPLINEQDLINKTVKDVGVSDDYEQEAVAKGILVPIDRGRIRGIKIGLTKNRRIVAIGLLEQRVEASSCGGIHQFLWQPGIPPIEWKVTAAIGRYIKGNLFSYRCHTSLGSSTEAAGHLVQVTGFLDCDSQVRGFRFGFADSGPVPITTQWIPGKSITYMVDGPGGERIQGLEVFWSDRNEIAGLDLLTNRRRANFATAWVSGDDLLIERSQVGSRELVTGIFGQTEVVEGRRGPYQNFGLMYTNNWMHGNSKCTSLKVTEDERVFDDQRNIWTCSSVPPPNLQLGESISWQPHHGFIGFLDLNQSIKSITACLGAYSSAPSTSPVDLIGLKIDYYHEKSSATLLGRCEKLGPSFNIEKNDRISKIGLGGIFVNSCKEPQKLSEIFFTTVKGMATGFRGPELLESPTDVGHHVTFQSGGGFELAGLVWSFDLRLDSAADHGIQPLFNLKPEVPRSERTNIQKLLYPSHPWTYDLPSPVRLRPIPSKEGNYYPITPLLLNPALHIVSIHVYFNAFLQGIAFTLSNNETYSIGNSMGVSQEFHIGKDEHIYTVSIYQRYQHYIRTQMPGDILTIEGLRFGVCKWIDGKIRGRHSPRFGPTKPFGPFLNEQRGFWAANRGGSAGWEGCFPLKEIRIDIQPGTSFAGMYLECCTTHTRRAGVLISFDERSSLPETVKSLFLQPLTLEKATTTTTAINNDTSGPPDNDNESLPPYLGTPPPSTFIPLPFSGRAAGTYRLWCPSPHNLSKIIVYRHQTWGRTVVIGLEFISRDEEHESTLLGHRSFWIQHSVEFMIAEGERVVEFKVEGQHSEGQGFENAKVITCKEGQQGNLDGPGVGKKTIGFYAYVGEFIEGIGILEGIV